METESSLYRKKRGGLSQKYERISLMISRKNGLFSCKIGFFILQDLGENWGEDIISAMRSGGCDWIIFGEDYLGGNLIWREAY